jgi:hypothetical protein
MRTSILALLLLVLAGTCARAQAEKDPPVVAKMEAVGTVYWTRRDLPAPKPAKKGEIRKNVIVGVDFRPNAMTDPKQVADIVRELATLPDLDTVLFLGQPFTDEAADAIPKTLKLVSIRFFNTRITDKGIAKLSRFDKLQVFAYTGSELTDEGMKSIGKMKTLNTVLITDAKITDTGVLALRELFALRRLQIENSAASEKSVEMLRSLLPRLNGIRDFG